MDEFIESAQAVARLLAQFQNGHIDQMQFLKLMYPIILDLHNGAKFLIKFYSNK